MEPWSNRLSALHDSTSNQVHVSRREGGHDNRCTLLVSPQRQVHVSSPLPPGFGTQSSQEKDGPGRTDERNVCSVSSRLSAARRQQRLITRHREFLSNALSGHMLHGHITTSSGCARRTIEGKIHIHGYCQVLNVQVNIQRTGISLAFAFVPSRAGTLSFPIQSIASYLPSIPEPAR